MLNVASATEEMYLGFNWNKISTANPTMLPSFVQEFTKILCVYKNIL